MTIQQMMMGKSPWVPNVIDVPTMVAWWDASDTSTITFLSSNFVDRWYDKVLTTRYATNNAGGTTVSPTWSATARNSKPGLTFDGNDRLPISAITNFPTGSNDSCGLYVAYKNFTSQWSSVLAWGTTTGGAHRNMGVWDGNQHTWDTWESSSDSGITWSSGTDNIVYQEHQLSQATDRSYYVINGALSKTTGSSAGTGKSTSTTRGTIGDSASAAQDVPWTGVIQEIFLFNAFLSDDIRQKFEGYSAHKWGLSSLLPAGHPYKSGPP